MKLMHILLLITLSAHGNQEITTNFNAGIEHLNKGDLIKSSDCFLKALALNPNNKAILANCALVHRKCNNLEQSIALYEKLLALHGADGNASFGLAQAYLAHGNIDKGWDHFNKWRSADVLQRCPQTLNEIKGKTVLIRAEWGLGDMIHFIRYAQILKDNGAHVTFESPESLCSLLKSCSFLDAIIPMKSALPQTDYVIPLLYLPTLCKTTAQTIPACIPYIKADAVLVKKWKETITKNTNLNIGICWDVGHHDTNIIAWQRTALLNNWETLLAMPHINIYNLQKDCTTHPHNNELQKYPSIHNFGPQLDTICGAFADTAAIMQHLDLVITVDTSIAHLAGALGIPVWTLLPYSPDYRWTLHGSTTPWYPSMRLFRQREPGNWHEVMQEVVHALTQII